jgi:chlorite dismutase
MSAPNPYLFSAGSRGPWAIDSVRAIRGPGLAPAVRLEIADARTAMLTPALWRVRGLTSHAHYATRSELQALERIAQPLGRPGATAAVMIPIRKSEAWWALAQDERRRIFEEASHHTALGLAAGPAIARKLYHSRAICEEFDFVTWFEFAAGDAPVFDTLTAQLRATEEWTYVEREVEVRMHWAE